ncbi:uncharacterized protein JCM15063_005609 [Sporobolomyces koalae]|uniref:uncharacterized protein n=1 Tax=Sporobolomyces koalae TaxID=500713 RepID=UPI00317281D4
MDSDNPWGASSASPSPNLTATANGSETTESAPRLSLEVEEEDASWGTGSPRAKQEADDVEEAEEPNSPEAEPTGASEPNNDHEEDNSEIPTESRTEVSQIEVSSEAATTSPPDQAQLAPPIPLVNDASTAIEPVTNDPEKEQATQSPEPADTFTVSLPPVTATPSEAPPMDDFDDFDDDDGFGEMGDAAQGDGNDDDFGDFGDFRDSAPLDESAFDAVPSQTTTEILPTVLETVQPAATPFLPPLRLALSSRPTRRTVAPQLREFVSNAWGDASRKVSEEPERQTEGVTQVMVSEEARNLFTSLSSLPPLRPLDWKRSKIRREHLISMGIPVNLDDSNDTRSASSLAISSSSRPSGTLSRPSSAPPGASPLPFSSPRGVSRSSTPFADRERTRRTNSPPPLDKNLVDSLLAFKEDDLTLMSLDKLRSVTQELERISVEASEVLTHALLMREKESQDKETYNGMISDLVTAAAKMKTTSLAAGNGKGRDPKRQGSIRWGRGGG